MLTLLPSGLVLATLCLLFALFVARSVTRQHSGLGFAERGRLRREGLRRHATVFDVMRIEHKMENIAWNDLRVVIEMKSETGEVSRVRLPLLWNWEKWGHLVARTVLPVLVDPKDQTRAMVDYATLRTERRSAAGAERAAQEARQQALVDQDRK